jgi:2-polyprenyl-3-methyl-5-hydroxy-6-metoxy-1,4-benzoquinol methylase
MNQSMKKSDRFWDWIARRYDKQVQGNEGYAKAVERFAKYLNADDTVLDYACGTGVVTYKIAADVKEVHAIDTSAKMIDLAKKGAREREVANVHFARKTIFDDSLLRESYDVILAFNILHLLEDARKAVERASELLKPGGLIVCSTPCLGEAGVVLRTLLPLIRKVIGLSYLRTFRISEVKDLMQDGGFQILESEVRQGTIQLCFVVAGKR